MFCKFATCMRVTSRQEMSTIRSLDCCCAGIAWATFADVRGNFHRTTIYIVCRPTEKEAQDYLDYYVTQNADWDAADKLMTGLITHSKTFRTSNPFPHVRT